jgi:predicted cobalt transporter CbtA
MDKKAYSTGFGWLVALILVFALGLFYIIFNQVILVHIIPVIDAQAPNTMNSSQITEMDTQINKYLNLWQFVPIIIIIAIIVFVVANSMSKENGAQY